MFTFVHVCPQIQILVSILSNSERGSEEILRELQRLFPGRYEPSHLRTLQRGVRKIRARLRATVQVQWQQEVIQVDGATQVSPRRPEVGKMVAPLRVTVLPPASSPGQSQAQAPTKIGAGLLPVVDTQKVPEANPICPPHPAQSATVAPAPLATRRVGTLAVSLSASQRASPRGGSGGCAQSGAALDAP